MSQTRNPNAVAVPAVTIDYSRAALNLVNRRLQTLRARDPSENLSNHDEDEDSPPSRNTELSEWYLRIASMLDDHHPGYVFSDSEHNQFRSLLPSPQKSQETKHRVMPACRVCGSMIFPGTEYTQCRLGANNKRKRKRQPKKGRQNTHQPDGLLGYHPDLEGLAASNVKNTMIITCRLCGTRCKIPALERRAREQNLKQEDSRRPVKENVQEQADLESLDFIQLSAVQSTKSSYKQDTTQSTLPLQNNGKKKTRKKDKKKSKRNTSQLYNFLNTLND